MAHDFRHYAHWLRDDRRKRKEEAFNRQQVEFGLQTIDEIDPQGRTDVTKKEAMTAMESGATRSSSEGKPDYRGYISPLALRMFGEYMLRHQTQADGKQRSSDNWKKGMPLERYIESLMRHNVAFHEVWDRYVAGGLQPGDVAVLEEEMAAMYFNVQGWMHEWVKNRAV